MTSLINLIKPRAQIYIGVMSGTSLDGVDAVAMSITAETPPTMKVLGAYSLPFSPHLREACLRLQAVSDHELHCAHTLALELAQLYSEAILGLITQLDLNDNDIAAVGVHGQTIRHRPECGYTIQLNQPALIAERTGQIVVSDFRARDIAAGGQGAPLVPAFHDALWRKDDACCVVINIGGFANISVLARDGSVMGFDTGPGNVLMDAWIEHHQGKTYDANGAWASQGTVHHGLLARCLAEPYFALPAPKSTGRDTFHWSWLNAQLQDFTALSAADVQATLLELTAQTIADAVRHHAAECTLAIIAGGGAANAHLMQRLRAILSCTVCDSSQAKGKIPPQQIEGAAFAWLAYRTLNCQTANLPEVTGARGARILGQITLP